MPYFIIALECRTEMQNVDHGSAIDSVRSAIQYMHFATVLMDSSSFHPETESATDSARWPVAKRS